MSSPGWRRKKEEEEEEEDSGRTMDVSLLREQYRSTTETQRRHTQVLLFRTVSEELSDAISVVPVTQGLTSPWKPNGRSPPVTTFDPDPTAYDPWHVHLGLHRRCCRSVSAQLMASSPETTNTNSSSRWSSSSSEAGGSQLDVDSSLDPPSPCSSSSRTKEEEEHFDTNGSRGDPQQVCPVQVSVSGSLDPGDGSTEDHPDASFSSSDESSTLVASTPVTSTPCSSTPSLNEDPKTQNQSAAGQTRNGVLQGRCSSAWGRGSRKFSAPALRFTRQLSVGGMGSSTGVHQNQNLNYHPFPSRKTPRISEAARRLGMYSSF
ncbi:uncharacterized protein ABDE67_018410 [Symphorus nematophorus]